MNGSGGLKGVLWLGLAGACAPDGEKAPLTTGDESGSGGAGETATDDGGSGDGADGGGAASDPSGAGGGGGGDGAATTAGSAGGDSGEGAPRCGDGVLDPGEQCDLGMFDEAACAIERAPLVCRADCSLEPATCCAPSGAPCVAALDTCCGGCNGMLGTCN